MLPFKGWGVESKEALSGQGIATGKIRSSDNELQLNKPQSNSPKLQKVLNPYWLYSICSFALLEALLITILLRNRKRYKTARYLLQQAQHDLEKRVVERTDKLHSLNAKLYNEIAKHETTEELLRESQEYINSIINSMPSILIGVTPSGAITHWNSGAEQATGKNTHSVLGRALYDIYPELPVSPEIIKDSIRQNIAKVLENVQFNDGSYAEISVYPLVSEKLSGAVVRVDDVTMRVQFENMMIQTEKMMSLGELAAGTAHEINNPLSAILQGVQNIERRLSSSLEKNIEVSKAMGIPLEKVNDYLKEREIIQFIHAIKEAGERATHIVKNMLEFSRSNNPDHALVNLIDLVDHTLELAESSFELDAGIEFNRILVKKDYADDLPSVSCASAEIQQVILNLLRNAGQALHSQVDALDKDQEQAQLKQPTIELRITFNDEFVTIEIADNGPGIPEAIRRRIFEPFFTTKEVGQGTGLGLSVSYFIVTEHHGGTIEVESTPETGCRFIIRLPRA